MILIQIENMSDTPPYEDNQSKGKAYIPLPKDCYNSLSKVHIDIDIQHFLCTLLISFDIRPTLTYP